MARKERREEAAPREARTAVLDMLRQRIVGGLHLGHLHPGDRLPSIRALSEELGEDHRAVGSALRALAEEGLVEVRERKGVYLPAPGRVRGDLLEEKARWLKGILVEARRRGTPVPAFPELVRDWTARTPMRCACIESNTDQMTALRTELAEDFGVESVPVRLAELEPALARGSARRDQLPAALEGVHLLVTTAFHGPAVRRAARALGTPVLVATIEPELVATIERHLAGSELALVCVDPAFGDRFRSLFRGAREGGAAIRVVRADDAPAVAALDRARPVLLTRAAADRLGDTDLRRLVPAYPSISHESAAEIVELLIRHNLTAGA
ncbi:MAG: GntR family transcriptional regulator [Gemmatimonadetes bacterium]|nr:GntR family transcriptional regulator [Gemmatimonadota bacterium]